MKTGSLTIHRIDRSADPAFAGLASIYTEAHPASERKSIGLLAAMIQRPEYLFLAASEESRVVGFAIVLCFPQSSACLLEYLAIAQDRRSHGLGQSLFTQVATLPEVAGRYLLIEVDSNPPQAAPNPSNARRKAFYRKLGCRQIEGLAYIMPPVSLSAPPPMEMLVYKSPLPAFIGQAHLREWLQCCYVEVYGRAADDRRIDSMLQGLPQNLRLA